MRENTVGQHDQEPKDLGLPFTREVVFEIVDSFFIHIADNWDTYKESLPHLRRTMMYYNEFALGIKFLPENKTEEFGIDFNPIRPLLDGDLENAFGDKFTKEIGSVVYDAQTRRIEFKPWLGYEEPIEDTPEAYLERWPTLASNLDEAKKMLEGNSRWETIDSKGYRVGVFGTPEIFYKGFTTIEEFPAQKEFLDTIRNNRRIQYGISLLEELAEMDRIKKEEDDARWDKLLAPQRERYELNKRPGETFDEWRKRDKEEFDASMTPEERKKHDEELVKLVQEILDKEKSSN